MKQDQQATYNSKDHDENMNDKPEANHSYLSSGLNLNPATSSGEQPGPPNSPWKRVPEGGTLSVTNITKIINETITLCGGITNRHGN
jgi:hypothetical protein